MERDVFRQRTLDHRVENPITRGLLYETCHGIERYCGTRCPAPHEVAARSDARLPRELIGMPEGKGVARDVRKTRAHGSGVVIGGDERGVEIGIAGQGVPAACDMSAALDL